MIISTPLWDVSFPPGRALLPTPFVLLYPALLYEMGREFIGVAKVSGLILRQGQPLLCYVCLRREASKRMLRETRVMLLLLSH